NTKTGGVYVQGRLSDPGDGSFSSNISLNEEGTFKVFVTVVAPTFTRQAHIPFEVSRGLASLVHIPANEFTGEPDRYQVVLHGAAQKFRNLSVGLLSKIEGSEAGPKAITLNSVDSIVYPVPLDRLSPGENIVLGVVAGFGE